MVLRRREVVAGGTLTALLLSGKRAAAMGQVMELKPPRPAPATPFYTADGAPRTLGDYRGKNLLVNLWATWCMPCVRELPSLSALAGKIGAEGFTFLPISSDIGGAPRVEAFFKQHGITNLPVLIDKDMALMQAFGARGLPSTYVINAKGMIVGLEEGGMNWNAPDIVAGLRALVAAPMTKA
jgi:peroxiredoxin